MGTPGLNPGIQFFHDLQLHISSLKNKGLGILLAVDANSHNDGPSSKMDSLMDRTSMIDLILAKHPISGGHPLPNTYNRGTKRIDFLCCTYELLFAVERVGYDAFGEIYDSDHRGMTLDLNWSKLRGINVPDDITRSKCLSIRRKDHILAYKHKLMTYFQQHNISSRIQRLQTELSQADLHSPASVALITTLIDQLDHDYTRAMLSAAKACKGGYTTPLSSKWSLSVKSLATGI
jgi:hypothetical protein